MHSAAGWGKRTDMVVHSRAPLNCEPPPTALAAEITAGDAFYCRNHGPIPDITPQDWRLTVGGDVAEPLTLTYDDLLARFVARDVTATLQCAGNRRAELLRVHPMPGKEPWAQGAISTAVWHGAALSEVLRAAGVRRTTGHVAFTGAEVAHPPQKFGASIPLAKALSGEVLLTFGMNGEPLPRIHGGPVRVVVPGFIGARSVKWLTSITVQQQSSSNHFQAVDYRVHGIALSTLALNCAILTPDDGVTVPAGPLTITGYAIAGDCTRISRVEVSPDGGTHWYPAELTPPRNAWTWRHWTLDVAAASGPLSIIARALDDTGAAQPESVATLWNQGGYANNAWARAQVMVG